MRILSKLCCFSGDERRTQKVAPMPPATAAAASGLVGNVDTMQLSSAATAASQVRKADDFTCDAAKIAHSGADIDFRRACADPRMSLLAAPQLRFIFESGNASKRALMLMSTALTQTSKLHLARFQSATVKAEIWAGKSMKSIRDAKPDDARILAAFACSEQRLIDEDFSNPNALRQRRLKLLLKHPIAERLDRKRIRLAYDRAHESYREIMLRYAPEIAAAVPVRGMATRKNVDLAV